MSLDQRMAAGPSPAASDLQVMNGGGDVRRCWGCRNLWPRASMRWGSVTEGPLWYPRAVRVLRCPDCLE